MIKYGFLLLVSCFSTSCSESIKVGQTWKQTFNEDNPYETVRVNYKKVIEITGEYVLYTMNDKDTLNEKKYWFVVSSQCVDNCR